MKKILFLSEFYGMEKQYVTKWLELNGYGLNELSNPIELYGIDGSIGAVCFDLNSTGYLIINTYNLDIMEYCFDGKSPLNSYENVIYNGPLEYYIEKNGSTIDLLTKNSVDKKSINNNYQLSKISEEEKSSKLEIQEAANSLLWSVSAVETGSLANSLVTWSSSYYCHPDSAAIMLKYLCTYKNSKFLPTTATTNNDVQDYLTNTYIINDGTTPSAVVNGGVSYSEYDGSTLVTKYTKGMAQYLVDRGLSSLYSAVAQSYNFTTIKTKINNNYPVVIGVSTSNPSNTWGEDHAVVVHSYMVGYDGVPFVFVNNTFGSNDISVNGSLTYFSGKEIWYVN